MLFLISTVLLLPPADEPKFASERIVEPFVKQLKDPRPGTRIRGIEGLVKLGADAQAAIPDLIEALRDANKNVREAAAAGLPRLGPKVVPALSAALRDKNVEGRFLAAMALAEMGPAAKEAVSDLTWSVKFQPDLRVAASVALGKIGKPAIAEIVLLFREKDAQIRYHALWSLANIGRDALDAVPEFTPLLSDKDASVRAKALYALVRIKPESLVGTALLQPIGMY
jgi:HEAT repeat protein